MDMCVGEGYRDFWEMEGGIIPFRAQPHDEKNVAEEKKVG